MTNTVTQARMNRSPRRRVHRLALVALLCAALPTVGGCRRGCPEDHAPKHLWAQPIEGDGLEGVYRLSPMIFRGPQPSDEQYAALKRIGVRTVVSLRFLNDTEQQVREHGLGYIRTPIKVWDPDDEAVAAALAAITDPINQPVYMHCNLGSDRTGLVTAAYRVIEQGWSRQEAICEMERPETGFWLWRNLVSYLREMDTPRLRRMIARQESGGRRSSRRSSSRSSE